MFKYNYTSLENRVIIKLERLPDHPWATISEVEYLCIVAKWDNWLLSFFQGKKRFFCRQRPSPIILS